MVVSESIGDPQRWNRYGFGLNNPLRYIDPDGRYSCESSETLCAQFDELTSELRSLVKTMEDSDDRSILKQVLNFCGMAGKANGVTIKELGVPVGLKTMIDAHARSSADLWLSRKK